MKNNVYFLGIFILISFIGAAQKNENKITADLVVFENQNTINVVDSIIKSNNDISNKGIYWYLDFTKKQEVILSLGRIENLIASHKDSNVFISIIGNKPLLIFIRESDIHLIKKTTFNIDLTKYKDKFDFSFEDFSYWILVKENENYKIIKEKKYKTN